MGRLERAARAYVAPPLSLPIFGLSERTKFPTAGSHGWKDAAPDATPWDRRPSLNIGIAVSPARLVLIDDDRGVADPLPWDLPPTWTVHATRGPHRYFRLPEGRAFGREKLSGVDVIERGYGLLPPSVHPSGHVYRWDAALNPWTMAQPAVLPHELTGIADPWADREWDGIAEGAAVDSFLGVAFAALGWLGRELGGGKHAVRCPWAAEHSADTGASSTVIFAPRVGGLRVGSFACRHGHCKGRKTDDVIAALPRAALVAAATAGYRRELVMLGRKSK